jgi:hypothetical protein
MKRTITLDPAARSVTAVRRLAPEHPLGRAAAAQRAETAAREAVDAAMGIVQRAERVRGVTVTVTVRLSGAAEGGEG